MLMNIDEATLETTLFPYIGYAAGLATVLTFAIQTLRIVQTKNVTNLSSYMYIMYSLGSICWFAYGVYIESWILVFSNLITFFFVFIILCLILYYDAEDKIERARRDPETYLFNRQYFTQAVPEKIGQALAAGQNFAVMMLSFANYQNITEKHGKKIGSKALKTLAKYLDKALRNTDMIARYDDNSFSIYIDNADDKIAKIVAGRLNDDIKKLTLKSKDNQDISFDVTLGISSSKQDHNLEALLNKAAEALKTATPRSRVKLYSEKKSK